MNCPLARCSCPDAPRLVLLLLLAASGLCQQQPVDGRKVGAAAKVKGGAQQKETRETVPELALAAWRALFSSAMSRVQGASWYVDWDELTSLSTENRLPGIVGDPDYQGKDYDMMQLVQCLNSQHNKTARMSWKAAMGDQPPSVRAVAAFWTNHHASEMMTVVTSASVSRLPQLHAQCHSWPGPLSAVLYQPLPSPHPSAPNQAALRASALQIAELLLDMQRRERACKLDVTLVYEVYNDESARRLLYPFNLLRNLARLQARSPLLALLDVDLVVGRGLSVRVGDTDRAAELSKRASLNNTVFIVPAFDVRGQHDRAAWADALCSSSKDMLLFALSKGIAVPFQYDAYPEGHRLTNFDAWRTATEDYPVQHEYRCEPWLVGASASLPWCDSRYRGYGLDKVQCVMDAAARGLRFMVMHDAFVIHRAHKKGSARDLFILGKLNRTSKKSLFNHNWELFQRQNALKERGQVWDPALSPATQHCLRVLPWLRGIKRP